MKKVYSALLALVLVFALCSCAATSPTDKVKAYIEANETELLEAFEGSFTESSGMTCTSDITVEGAGFIVTININELNDVDESVKTTLQSSYDSIQSTWDGMLSDMQTELPELEYFEFRICEVDGDLLATVRAD